MTTEALRTQRVQLLARKAQLRDEQDQIDRLLGQIDAILQFADAQTPATPAE